MHEIIYKAKNKLRIIPISGMLYEMIHEMTM